MLAFIPLLPPNSRDEQGLVFPDCAPRLPATVINKPVTLLTCSLFSVRRIHLNTKAER